MVSLAEGDCLELMDSIPDDSVDMVLCDLPYGLTQNSWDKPIPFEPLWEQYWRVCKKNAAIVLFSQMPFTIDLVNSQRKYFRYEWIYQKSRTAGYFNANRMPLKVHENVCVFYQKLPTYNPQYWYSKPYTRKDRVGDTSNYNYVERIPTVHEDGRRYPIDVIKFNNSSASDRTHPTEKPIDLCEYFIKTYTDKGETVLDNCMGSGSTGVACMNTERDFIGIELDAGYFETAKQRICEACPLWEEIKIFEKDG